MTSAQTIIKHLSLVLFSGLICSFGANFADAQGYNCFHYLTGEPVSCEDDPIQSPQVDPQQQTFTYQTPPPTPTQPPDPEPVLTERDLREEEKITIWHRANDRYGIGDYVGALSGYKKALELCEVWSLRQCNDLRSNIKMVQNRLHKEVQRQAVLSDIYAAREIERNGDTGAALDAWLSAYARCTGVGFDCEILLSEVKRVSVKLHMEVVWSTNDPVQGFAHLDAAFAHAFALYLDCDSGKPELCDAFLDIQTVLLLAIQRKEIDLRDQLKETADARMGSLKIDEYVYSSSGSARAKTATARLYLELMRLPDDSDLDVLQLAYEAGNGDVVRNIEILQSPTTQVADGLIESIKGLFRDGWWGRSSASTILGGATDNATHWYPDSNEETELNPIDRLDVSLIEADALVFTADASVAGVQPTKVDLMLAAMHQANLMERELKEQGLSVTEDQKWQAAETFLRVVFLENTYDDTAMDAHFELSRIRKLAAMR